MKIFLKKIDEGFQVIDGHMRLQAALSLKDEVLVEVDGFGEMLIARMPDGSLVATKDEKTLSLLSK